MIHHPAATFLFRLETGNKAAQGAARGCQNIMGFPDGADQGEKAKTRCTVTAARREKHENTLIVELPIVFNNTRKPCGGCVVRFPHLFWQPHAAPCADLRAIGAIAPP